MTDRQLRPLRSAYILAVGSELTTGATRDTNSGDLAAELTVRGVRVMRSMALPDDLDAVRSAFEEALLNADIVVSTGGLGPTPDDLTREAIAAACGLEPYVDPDLEEWLRGLFTRRGLPMPEANLKQAWLVHDSIALANNHGSAPGWWLERPDGRVVIALPGPPREWRAMWRDEVLPRLETGRLGRHRAVRTLRLSGIGESALVDLIGEEVLRAPRPQVATYARMDAVDVVVSAESDDRSEGEGVVDAMVASLSERIGRYVFAEGNQTWADALAARIKGRTLAIVEIGTAGHLGTILGGAEFVVHAELERGDPDLEQRAMKARDECGADVGLAVRAEESGGDTSVTVAMATEAGARKVTRMAFLAGDEGRRRAALAACAALWAWLEPGTGDE